MFNTFAFETVKQDLQKFCKFVQKGEFCFCVIGTAQQVENGSGKFQVIAFDKANLSSEQRMAQLINIQTIINAEMQKLIGGKIEQPRKN